MRSTRDSRLDLLLFGPGQGRSGCGVAALWCTTHAGFGHFSPTYRVPSGTSRAKSGRVYSAQTSMTVTRLVAGSAGLNAAGIMPKVHDMWVNCKFGRQAGPLSCHRFMLQKVRKTGVRVSAGSTLSSPSGRGDTAPDNPLDNPLDPL